MLCRKTANKVLKQLQTSGQPTIDIASLKENTVLSIDNANSRPTKLEINQSFGV